MTQSNDAAFARPYSGPKSQDGLTKREYFAAKADIPWNVVLDTLSKKFPEKNGQFSIGEVLEYQASAKVMAADLLIKSLNKQQ